MPRIIVNASTRRAEIRVKIYAISSNVAFAPLFSHIIHERKKRRFRPQFRHEEARPSHTKRLKRAGNNPSFRETKRNGTKRGNETPFQRPVVKVFNPFRETWPLSLSLSLSLNVYTVLLYNTFTTGSFAERPAFTTRPSRFSEFANRRGLNRGISRKIRERAFPARAEKGFHR